MIYFIQGKLTKRIKIGFSKNPEQRIKQLQTSAAEEYETLLVLPGNYENETFFHKYFAEYRVKNEWFEPSPRLVEKIQEKKLDIERAKTEKQIYLKNRENRLYLNRLKKYFKRVYGAEQQTAISAVE
jgi:hypothetical protein